MPGVIWIVLGAVALAVFFGNSRGKGAYSMNKGKGPHRIDHPHVIDDDDYECSVCHRRFRQNTMICPNCGVRFSGRVTDEEEFDEEEEELEAWDEEDGL